MYFYFDSLGSKQCNGCTDRNVNPKSEALIWNTLTYLLVIGFLKSKLYGLIFLWLPSLLTLFLSILYLHPWLILIEHTKNCLKLKHFVCKIWESVFLGSICDDFSIWKKSKLNKGNADLKGILKINKSLRMKHCWHLAGEKMINK